jgi:hypothetical protein
LPVLDRQILFALSQGDWALELPLLQDFARDKQADLLQLLQAWQQGDQANVILLAHRIKGASRTVGAAAMADCAARLEAKRVPGCLPPTWACCWRWSSRWRILSVICSTDGGSGHGAMRHKRLKCPDNS